MKNNELISLMNKAHSEYLEQNHKEAHKIFSLLVTEKPTLKDSLQYFIERCAESSETNAEKKSQEKAYTSESANNDTLKHDVIINLNQELKIIRNSGLFDEDFYLETYPQVAQLGIDPIAHFCEQGWNHGYEPRADFSCSEYFQLNPDVCAAKFNPFCHYIEWGQKESNRYQPYRYLDYIIDPNTIITHESNSATINSEWQDVTSTTIALVIHLHYPSSVKKLAEIVNFFPRKTDLYITITSSAIKDQIINTIQNTNGSINIYEVPNSGRDIKPFFYLLRDVINDEKYDLICKLHGKSSKDNPHSSKYGQRWRDFMVDNLAGSTSVVNKIITNFNKNSKLSLIYAPAHFSVFPYLRWAENWEHIVEFVDALSLKNDLPLQHVEFPAGSMYWTRPSAIKKILNIFDEKKVPDEPLPSDGTYLHAFERLVTNLITTQQLTYRKHVRAKTFVKSYYAVDRTLSHTLNLKEEIEHKLELVDNLYRERQKIQLEFGSSPTPVVSVVIPVFNQIQTTEKCLLSLFCIRHEVDFEIIIVDDASTDGTPIALEKYQDITLIRNSRNVGFVGSCNAGLNKARGEYVLFLNNDTVVLEGSIKHLLKCFSNPSCGLSGSMLIYPDGSLQEAGGVVWENGGGLNYGRNQDPSHPDYNYMREADYCSGASIMIKRGLLNDLEGFDSAYTPGYYEDTDLAFRIRKKGLKVFFQPESKVIHLEGKTSGTDLTKGMKKYQEINKEKFLKRWRGDLSCLAEKIKNTNLYFNRSKKGRVLLVDSYLPTPDKDSGSKDVSIIIELLLNEGYEITFLPTEEILFKYKYWSGLTRFGVRVLYQKQHGDDLIWLEKCQNQFQFCIISRYSNFHRCVNHIRRLNSGIKVFFDTVDLHFLREQRQAEREKDHNKLKVLHQLENAELAAVKSADHTYVRSAHEIDLLNKRTKGRVGLLPICREIYEPKNNFDQRDGLVFIGGFKHKPNIDAVQYFIQEIWSTIVESKPDTKLHIAGSNSHLLHNAGVKTDLPGIKVIGYIEDIHQTFEHYKVNIVPLTYGAGTKGKLVSSLCSGIPCVSTPIGAEGIIGLENFRNILIANNPDEFASHCLRLLEDPNLWSKLSAEAYIYARENLSTSTMAKYLLEPFNS